jgi:hypothetical protein
MEPEYVLAYTTTGHILAESIVALLKSFGINAFTSQESAGITYGLTIGPLGEAKIYVPEEQLEEALHILEQMERGELQVASSENGDALETESEDQPSEEN